MLYRIGDFSRICRVTVRTLRYYDEIGLLKPVEVDTDTGYRYYSMEQIPTVNNINVLKYLGLSLFDIQELVYNGPPLDYVRQLLQIKKTEIQEHIRQEQAKLTHVSQWLERVDNGGATLAGLQIQQKTIPVETVISKRKTGPGEETLRNLREELLNTIQKNRGNIGITGPVIGLYYDEEFKEDDADIEVAIPVSGDLTIPVREITIKQLPAIQAITTIYKGTPEGMHEIYAQIIRYAEQYGLTLMAPVRELYLTDSEEHPSREFIVEIQCPLKKTG